MVTLTLDDAVIAKKSRLGIGVNGGGSWYNFVGAILVDDPSFEGPADSNGFAHDGWPWYAGGSLTASVEAGGTSGAQCQKVVVATAGASMNQGRAELPQAPLRMTARAGHTYRIKVRVRASQDGLRLRLGVLDGGWQGIYGADLSAGTSWAVVTSDYRPAADHLLRGITIRFMDAGTYWLDDLVAWDVDDIDPATGLSATFVSRLKELRPATLRLGGLGVNGIPLESYLRRFWDLDYGPPALGPDLDLGTFLRLCREVGADPFITVPPAFSDGSHWQVGDLTREVLESVYADHGNLVDYLGGGPETSYGARRQADGFEPWDGVFGSIYLELGNELWGTPDGKWDMDLTGQESQQQQMENYATYCARRMNEMKTRPGWRSNMRVGFCGRSPDVWLGGWPGSYDGTLIPAIGALTDFSTIDLYYGEGSASDSDEAIFGALFASAVWHERAIGAMKAAFRQANGGRDIETTVYEGNATWGPYESDLQNPSALYFKEVSLGAAVSLLDVYAAANRAGVTVNNHFHYGGNIWGATGPYPEVWRKPAFFALKMFNTELGGDLVGCAVQGGGAWDDALTGERGVPFVACYPYLEGDAYSVLLINRHRSEPREVRLPHRLAPQATITLSGADINQNNETGETIVPRYASLSGQLQDEVRLTLPPFSAVVLKASKSASPLDGGDGGADGDGDAGGDAFDAGPGDPGTEPDAGDVGGEAGGDLSRDGTDGTDETGADAGGDEGFRDRLLGSCGGCDSSSGRVTDGAWCLLLGIVYRFSRSGIRKHKA
ncbi:MAG: hypothetical protein GYA21_01315 [Myxococcales bacterium]|nr:hypothetical protein [Myxococcales bacterium]